MKTSATGIQAVYVTIACLALASCMPALAGVYTTAVKVNKLCTTTGMTLGADALEFVGNTLVKIREDEVEMDGYKAKVRNAPKNVHPLPADVQVAKVLIPILQEVHNVTKKSLVEIKSAYLNNATEAYGKPILKLADRVWREAINAGSEEEARQLGLAACMDYFLSR